MNDLYITVLFDGNGRVYRPGETLAGEYYLEGLPPDEVKVIEVSVLWYTEGKGDEDMAVHEFYRVNVEDGELDALRGPQRFATTLPQSPLSYDGLIVKLRWCVRVRAFLHGGKEVVGQKIFRLGDVPAAETQPVKALAS